MKKTIALAVSLTLAGLILRLFFALAWPTDQADDGRLYARIATNVISHHSFSIEAEEPYPPTFIRVPGYPLFIAGLYFAFGADNNRAVRIAQAVIDTATCWLIALLALMWTPSSWEPDRRRKVLLIGLALAVTCPFPAIYVATILTETCTNFLVVACALTASIGIKSGSLRGAISWWALSGISGGLATLFRPDSGLFVAAVGITLLLAGLNRARSLQSKTLVRSLDPITSPRRTLIRTFVSTVTLTIGFCMVLTPWAARNWRVFGVFQPIAPEHANMPGEFVPLGYIGWLRTWVDDVKYTESMEFPLDSAPIHAAQAPDYAFDSPEERATVEALFDRYNGTSAAQIVKQETKPAEAQPPPQATEPKNDDNADDAQPDEPDDSEPDEPDEPDANAEAGMSVEMTPDIDSGFAEVARSRIARNPLRYYVTTPFKRVMSLWFDTHSQFYPFQGELLPLSDLSHELHQDIWLPLFAGLTVVYSLLGILGGWLFWKHDSRVWLMLLVLLIVPRLVFLASRENPEPRYVVVFFPLVMAVSAIAICSPIWSAALKRLRKGR